METALENSKSKSSVALQCLFKTSWLPWKQIYALVDKSLGRTQMVLSILLYSKQCAVLYVTLNLRLSMSPHCCTLEICRFYLTNKPLNYCFQITLKVFVHRPDDLFTKMDKMFSRLRSISGKQLKSPTNETPPPSATPSKEDILTTLDGFGDKIQGEITLLVDNS